MAQTTLTVIIATCARPTLAATLQSIADQALIPGDEILVDINRDDPWGNTARHRRIPQAKANALLFMDDDDTYQPDAFTIIRRKFAAHPKRLHLFRKRYPGGELMWDTPRAYCGNVGTTIICVPNDQKRLGQWGKRFEGDWDFVRQTCRHLGDPIFHKDIIVNVGRPIDVPASTTLPDGCAAA